MEHTYLHTLYYEKGCPLASVGPRFIGGRAQRGALTMVTQTREKNAKFIPSLQELPLLGSVITHSGAGRFDLYRRIARECGDIGLFHLGPYRVIQIVSSDLVHSLLVEHANECDIGDIQHKAVRSITGN